MEEEKMYGSQAEGFSIIGLLVKELQGDSFHKLRISRIEEIPEREAEYATIKRPCYCQYKNIFRATQSKLIHLLQKDIMNLSVT